jgi:penicillin-binding protein 1A
VRDPFQSNRRSRRWWSALEIDAWIDSMLFGLGRALARGYGAFSAFMRRFRVYGFYRLIVEFVGDGLTIAAAGSVLTLAMALPAFEATKGDWRARGDLAVTFLDRNGNEIGKRGINSSDVVPLDAMPDILIKAVLATEDRRFYEHHGVDIYGTFRAIYEDARAGAVIQGGSSLTQQLAKNLFLSNERTIERKIKEAFLAVWLDANLSKDEVLKLYLDRAYMGGGAFGVEAASEFYFGRSVKDLDLPQAALLAGLFKAPTRYAPHANLPAARARANDVLTNMVEAGFLTDGQVISARRHPAAIVEHGNESGSSDFFLDWAYEQVKAVATGGERVLTVRTTVDVGMQRAAQDAIESTLRQSGAQYNVKQAALVSLEPDGAVRTMIGGRDYGESQFNRATNALRQPGSSFKPFVYATAVASGFTPQTVVQDAPICIGDWCPQNYAGGYAGAVTLATALARSLNTVAVRLSQSTGRQAIIDTAHRMGITNELPLVRSLPLGVDEVMVIDMAASYGAFATGGYKVTPYAFTEITNGRGDVIYDRRDHIPAPQQVLDQKTVTAMNSMLVNVPEWGTGTRAKLDGIRTAGKTGTTSDYRDAWFVGFTGNFVTAVWMGNDDFKPTKQLTGGILPAQIWHDFMTYAHRGIALKPIPFIDPPFEKPKGPAVASNLGAAPAPGIIARPTGLSPATASRLVAIRNMFDRPPAEPPIPATVGTVNAAATPSAVPAVARQQ